MYIHATIPEEMQDACVRGAILSLLLSACACAYCSAFFRSGHTKVGAGLIISAAHASSWAPQQVQRKFCSLLSVGACACAHQIYWMLHLQGAKAVKWYQLTGQRAFHPVLSCCLCTVLGSCFSLLCCQPVAMRSLRSARNARPTPSIPCRPKAC